LSSGFRLQRIAPDKDDRYQRAEQFRRTTAAQRRAQARFRSLVALSQVDVKVMASLSFLDQAWLSAI